MDKKKQKSTGTGALKRAVIASVVLAALCISTIALVMAAIYGEDILEALIHIPPTTLDEHPIEHWLGAEAYTEEELVSAAVRHVETQTGPAFNSRAGYVRQRYVCTLDECVSRWLQLNVYTRPDFEYPFNFFSFGATRYYTGTVFEFDFRAGTVKAHTERASLYFWPSGMQMERINAVVLNAVQTVFCQYEHHEFRTQVSFDASWSGGLFLVDIYEPETTRWVGHFSYDRYSGELYGIQPTRLESAPACPAQAGG